MWSMAKSSIHHGTGLSQRQLRVGELIRRTLSDVLMRGAIRDPDLNRISITVGQVVASPDLKIATAYVSALGGEKNGVIIKLLSQNKADIRRAISKQMTLKYTPDLRFRLDQTFDRMDDTRRLFADEKVKRDLDPE